MSAKKYSNLSKDEIYLISRAEFERQKIILTPFVQKLFVNKNKASKTVASLVRKGRMICVEKGKYLIVPIKAPNQQWAPNEFVVAALWMADTPYYIGYFTMYNYWGFTEQIPQTIFVLNLKKNVKKTIGSLRYEALQIDEKKYFGIQKISIEDVDVCISDKERTLVDFIFNPMGSWENVQTVVAGQIKSINLQKFIRYLIKFPVVAVRKRAGIMLEKAGVSPKELINLKKSTGKSGSYTVFNPFVKSRKGKVNQEWKVIIKEKEDSSISCKKLGENK